MENDRWVSYNSPLAAVSYDICMYDAGWREATGVYGRKVQLAHKGIIELHDKGDALQPRCVTVDTRL